jgi:competence protein ComGA
VVILLNIVEEKSAALLDAAIRVKASDIHIVPVKDKAVIQFRIDQQLVNREHIPVELSVKIVQHFKFLAGMEIGEKRRPQSGSLYMPFSGDRAAHLRLSTLPTMYEESLVIRLLYQDTWIPINRLVMFKHSVKQLLSLIRKPHGLVIITGPTGSGKTTTLYSLLGEAQSSLNRKIVTIEDPVEKQTEGVLQVQINERAGMTYASGLKAVLRHDPDIIMVGEIRDTETAKAAIRASHTGHLVLSTLHTKNTVGAIYRLRCHRSRYLRYFLPP